MSSSKCLIFVILTVLSAMKVQSSKVIIVGSGLSGYSAAARLMEQGITDITILEAEGRMGGRIYTVSYGTGKFIDLGAQWVHGQTGNSIFEMIGANFPFGSSQFANRDSICVISNGQNNATFQSQALKLTALTDKIIFNSYTAQSTYLKSMGDFFTEQYQKQTTVVSSTYSTMPIELRNMVLDLAPKYVNAFWSSKSWLQISPKLDQQSDEATGDQDLTWGTSGYKTVFDFINKKRPATVPSKFLDVDSKIILNKEVTNIKWNPNGLNDPVSLTCADGSQYTASYVIFTGSLGVLKARYSTLFTPSLPTDKITAINSLGFGTLNKLFLEFPTIFWPTSAYITGYTFLWKRVDADAIRTTDKAWLLDIIGFDRVDAYPNMIEMFYAGSNTLTFETMTDAKLQSDIMWLLNKFLATVVTSIPQPTKVTRTRWETQRNFLGSYSYSSMTALQNNVSPATLAKPMLDVDLNPKILFAGEACSSSYPSYAHGAVLSGRDVADWLVANW